MTADANKIRSPNVDRTDESYDGGNKAGSNTVARSRNQESTAAGLYMSLSAILNM